MKYLQLYIYRLRKVHRREFLNIMHKAREIYRKHGGYGEEVFRLHKKRSKYGLTGLWKVLPTTGDEEIWIGLDRYQSFEHWKEVMKKVNADPEIEPLYERVIQLVSSASRIVRGEFEMVAY
ncbi:MAG: DUF1428 family protein [Candidatus Bathyarchaeota archaeon]|nr:MAG: DUF1428 family protein [Candidatus Bathyarchaeota archaeon]